jgi:hypothetical protein
VILYLSLAVIFLEILGGKEGKGCDMLSQLESDNVHARHASMNHIIRNRDVSHEDIKAIAEKYIKQKRKGGTVRDALHLLGKLQAREQIPYLVSRLEYRVFEDDRSRPPAIETTFPAAGALIDIGLPAIKPVLERLRHENNPDALLAGAGVLRGVLGKSGALKRVETEMKGASGSELEALKSVHELLDTHFMLQ